MRTKATGKLIKSSVQKINEVANLIRNVTAEEALNQLRFCARQSLSKELIKVLNSAIANSENNHTLDVDRLVVDEVLVGKSKTLKRFRCRARGRGNRIEKPYSRVTIYLKERG
jgi:large subunit ribosomal protein L22